MPLSSPVYPNNLLSILGSVLLVVSIAFAVHPDALFIPVTGGLDNSWQVALQLAVKNGSHFGDDIIFTYGPLAYLSTRCPINVSLFTVYIFDMFIVANVVYILYSPLKQLPLFEKIIVLTGLLLTTDLFFFDWTPMVYLILGYYLVNNLQTQKPFEILTAAILSLILFFVKLNFGLFSTLIFLLYVVYLIVFFKRLRTKVLISLAVYLTTFLLCLFALKVDLVSYVLNTFEIISGYTPAMYDDMGDAGLFYLYGAVALVAVLTSLLLIDYISFFKNNEWRISKIDFQTLSKMSFTAFFIASTCYVLFKQSFVRADIVHIPTFFKFIIPLTCLLLLSGTLPFQKLLRIILALAVVVIVIQLQYAPSIPVLAKVKLEHTINYYRNLQAKAPEPGGTNLSKSVRDLIATESVDIMPTEIAMAYFNDLNYKPRPVFQSYSAYTEKLDDKNAESYRANDRPTFIIASPGSIDFRYFMWDESKTKLEILKNYDARLTEGSLIVFKKREHPLSLKVIQQEAFKMKMGEYKDLKPSDGLKYARIKVKPTFRGKLTSLLYHPPKLNVTFQLKNGTEITHRAVSTIIASGVLINKYVSEKTEEMLSFHTTHGHAGEEVQRIKFSSDQGHLFNDEIDVETTEMIFDQADASSGIAMSNEQLNFASDKMSHYVDKLEIKANSVEIVGWAFINEMDFKNLTTKIIISNDNEAMIADCVLIPRNDVSRFFGAKFDWDLCGFTSSIDRRRLKNGMKYKLTVSISDNEGNVIASKHVGDLDIPSN